MTRNNGASAHAWDDDHIPELTDEQLDRAEFSIGNVVVRPARDRDGNAQPRLNPGRPPLGDAAKRQVTLRLDGEVVEAFKAGGPGWQSRINAALRGAVGL